MFTQKCGSNVLPHPSVCLESRDFLTYLGGNCPTVRTSSYPVKSITPHTRQKSFERRTERTSDRRPADITAVA